MKICLLCVSAFSFLVGASESSKGSFSGNPYTDALKQRPWQSVQDYVEVRPGVFLFYWLYYADGTRIGAKSKPLVIWIQGGPGLAATGIGNFAEIGPLNMNMKPRNHTWVNGRNLLLIDHPVGTGFSYATNNSLLVKTDRDLALDLSKAIKGFLRSHKEFRLTPTYLIGQSYGGKICPRLGFYLHTAIQKNKLKMNLKGIGIGSGWVDPKESTLVEPDYLYNMGIIDQSMYLKAQQIVRNMSDLIVKKDYSGAEEFNEKLFNLIKSTFTDMSFNNINQPDPYPALSVLSYTVNLYVKPTLHMVNQSLQWSYVSDAAFLNMSKQFFVPSTKFLEMLLNTTKMKIAVYNGNLDVVTPLAGASNWVHKLRWPGAVEFREANRYRIRGDRNGYYKATKQLSFWCVFGSGHWVPEDNPTAMEQILEHLISD